MRIIFLIDPLFVYTLWKIGHQLKRPGAPHVNLTYSYFQPSDPVHECQALIGWALTRDLDYGGLYRTVNKENSIQICNLKIFLKLDDLSKFP